MNASQRINLLKELASRLSTEEWSVLDLTLSQFGVKTTDAWRGDKFPYILEMAQTASDEQLEGLAQHVGFDVRTPASSSLSPSFWRSGHLRLFLSHLSAERVLASDLKAALLPYGISAFVAHRDIEPTKEWQDEIELGLTTADALCALLHPSFHESKWTDQEVGFAMGRQLLVIPIRLGMDPYGFIGKYQALPGVDRPAQTLAHDLFQVLSRHKQTADRMAEAVVTRFEAADSFRVAKDTMGHLEALPTLNAALQSRIRAAVTGNTQVGEAFGVPERVTALLARAEGAT